MFAYGLNLSYIVTDFILNQSTRKFVHKSESYIWERILHIAVVFKFDTYLTLYNNIIVIDLCSSLLIVPRVIVSSVIIIDHSNQDLRTNRQTLYSEFYVSFACYTLFEYFWNLPHWHCIDKSSSRWSNYIFFMKFYDWIIWI